MAKSYEVIERVGTSTESICDAASSVVSEAHREKPVAWFKILEQRGRVNEEGKPEFQVIVEIGRKIS
jgi:flavin-binding protein dodecin